MLRRVTNIFVHETFGATPLAPARRRNPPLLRRVSNVFDHETIGATPLALARRRNPPCVPLRAEQPPLAPGGGANRLALGGLLRRTSSGFSA